MTDDQVHRFKEWRVKAASKHSENAMYGSKRASLMSQLSMAEELTELDRFWFPHSVDFRGRLYSIVPELNPQADDFGKSMLEFAEGKPLGEFGAFWLAVHIANLFGVDKVSFEDRVRWVEENTNAILDSAMAPLDGGRFWCTADKPWCALAACMEWLGFQRDGADYISHLPVAMDGSCSGLQHFSAMLLDSSGAQAVNLTDNDKPADIYTQVQERTEELLLEAQDNVSYAWRGKVTRKIVKRPCMTFAYSVTSRGIRDQILDELRKATGESGYLSGFDNWEAAMYLAPIVEQAIRDTVERAGEAMDWLKEVVRLLLDAKRPVTWSTPLGFIVQQHYTKSVGKKFFVMLDGTRRELVLRIDSDVADKRKQASAVAPNFVHSLDACHLQQVVNRMVEEGVTTSFAVIHDSFGVHACDVDELHYVIRDEFVKLYSVSQLEKFRNWVLSSLPSAQHGEVPPVPTEGTYDIQEVRRADFFFA
jgi:DNA-directed RNA polymerase